MRHFSKQWNHITTDPFILDAISGYKLEFQEAYSPPHRGKPPYHYRVGNAEESKIDIEIRKLVEKGVIEECQHVAGEFVSNIFTRPKKNGDIRLILDLSDLNDSLNVQHFKMDNIHTATTLISPGCYLASIDLRDAYYSVPIHPSYRKYLRFVWHEKCWQFKVLPNGLSTAPRLFTKLMKPVFAKLRQAGHLVVGYLDDTLIIGETESQALEAVQATTKLLSDLGFVIHSEKSILEPQQRLQFLGFILDSESMTITLPHEKCQNIRAVCAELLGKQNPTIRQVAQVIGKLIATFPAIQYGPLFYRNLERDKILALKSSKGHFDRPMNLSEASKQELMWWFNNIHCQSAPISRDRPALELRTDASGQGWGATDLSSETGGRWDDQEIVHAQNNEINYLEILAAGLGLKSFCGHLHDTHVLIRTDNTTAVAYLNNMGGIKSRACDRAARDIWVWCKERNIWITAAYLPGRDNTEADRRSRHFNDRTEWMLNKKVFTDITKKCGTPQIDLFASRLNKQLPAYVTWLPDPDAVSVDAFTLNWGDLYFYAFPPFCLIPKCLQKIENDKAHGLLIVPNWPTQAWFPRMRRMLKDEPLLIPRHRNLITQPVSGEPHPLHACLDLLCCRF